MNVRMVAEAVLLGSVVLSCWIGCAGMVRMREPMQALHYVAVPACAGSVLLVLAMFVQTGNSAAAWKSILICVMLLGINGVVAHATARAFRTRDLGHWQPRPEDHVQRVSAQEPGA